MRSLTDRALSPIHWFLVKESGLAAPEYRLSSVDVHDAVMKGIINVSRTHVIAAPRVSFSLSSGPTVMNIVRWAWSGGSGVASQARDHTPVMDGGSWLDLHAISRLGRLNSVALLRFQWGRGKSGAAPQWIWTYRGMRGGGTTEVILNKR